MFAELNQIGEEVYGGLEDAFIVVEFFRNEWLVDVVLLQVSHLVYFELFFDALLFFDLLLDRRIVVGALIEYLRLYLLDRDGRPRQQRRKRGANILLILPFRKMRIFHNKRTLMPQMHIPKPIRPIVIIDHTSKFHIVLTDLLIPSDYGITLHDF